MEDFIFVVNYQIITAFIAGSGRVSVRKTVNMFVVHHRIRQTERFLDESISSYLRDQCTCLGSVPILCLETKGIHLNDIRRHSKTKQSWESSRQLRPVFSIILKVTNSFFVGILNGECILNTR